MLRNNLNRLTAVFIVIFAATALWSQEQKPQTSTGTYRLEYVFSELQDGKRVNARSYTVLVRAKDKGVLKIGSRVPIFTGGSKDASNSIQYFDVGVNIDFRVDEELDSAIVLMTSADISSVLPEGQVSNHTGDPVVRQERYNLENIVPVGKVTLLGSADEVDGTRRLQIEVTATKVR